MMMMKKKKKKKRTLVSQSGTENSSHFDGLRNHCLIKHYLIPQVSDDKALVVEFPDADAQSAFLEGINIKQH
jgi:hypothetical protein